ncbi:glycine zipper domain-containing protein [Ancylobacter terrae]|uniref:glycine zipper domain-containing protein n=1 Tax=Ancylobacter sp. sgz301288 TaxID=3342077 RepID=UPI00385AA2A9
MSIAAAFVAAGLALAPAAFAQNRTTTGAVVGGATGAVVGGAVTGSAGGAVAGAVVGGVTGAAIGNSRSRARSGHFWRNGRCYYRDRNGRVVRSPNSHCRR